MKRVAVFGSTGSVGKKALSVLQNNKDEFELVAIASKSSIDILISQAKEFSPKAVGVCDFAKADLLQEALPGVAVFSGKNGLEELAALDEVDIVVMAISGTVALGPTISAIKAKKRIAIASKEVFVCAGEYISSLVKESGAEIIPVDSEHSAIFQCLKNEGHNALKRVVLTASGGPFLQLPIDKMDGITPAMALTHPTYHMGPKNTVDSSTLMNKGLEIIEAAYLFDLDLEKIDVVIHPQSVIHSFVEFLDGSLLAQLSPPDMYFPLQYALNWPFRKKSIFPAFDFKRFSRLDFLEPDEVKFPCLRLAKEALRCKKSFPCYLNAANEILVSRFLKGEIRWSSISIFLEKLISSHSAENLLNLDVIMAVDAKARKDASIIF